LATLALESGGNLDTIAGDTTSIDGKIVVCDTGNVDVVSSVLPTGAATEATLATLATEATLATLATEATVATLALESGGNLADVKTLITGQVDGEKAYIGGAFRTINFIKFSVGVGTSDIVAAVTDQKIYLLGWTLHCDTDDGTFKWVEETTGDLSNASKYKAGGGEVVPNNKCVLLKTATANKKLQGTATVATFTGLLWYCQF
jgi:hypothetical protein